jgi:hypothetical protein
VYRFFVLLAIGGLVLPLPPPFTKLTSRFVGSQFSRTIQRLVEEAMNLISIPILCTLTDAQVDDPRLMILFLAFEKRDRLILAEQYSENSKTRTVVPKSQVFNGTRLQTPKITEQTNCQATSQFSECPIPYQTNVLGAWRQFVKEFYQGKTRLKAKAIFQK